VLQFSLDSAMDELDLRTEEISTKTPSGVSGFLLQNNPELQKLFFTPTENEDPRVNDAKIRRLYMQAASQQWYAPQRINFDQEIKTDDESLRIWRKFITIFYTLEKMGLNVIQNMMSKAVRKYKSEEMAFYLSAQTFDEARHVFAIEAYLRKLGAPPKYDWKYHVLGQVASMGAFRVENWLFSTLFSENFASTFIRRARQANIDPVGNELCKYLLVDESRHLHFLHIVLPDVMDRLSMMGRTYVKGAQFFIMKFSEMVLKSMEAEAAHVGLDRKAMMEEIFENVEKGYESFGVSRKFLWFPNIYPTKITPTQRIVVSH
jgi:P-aminobenzoate N-oxygenase AurF